MAFPAVWSSTPKWRPIAATVTPWSRIPAASAAIRWYTGVVGGSRNSTSTGIAAKVRNLCEHVQNSPKAPQPTVFAGLTAPPQSAVHLRNRVQAHRSAHNFRTTSGNRR